LFKLISSKLWNPAAWTNSRFWSSLRIPNTLPNVDNEQWKFQRGACFKKIDQVSNK
jgi:hypothetical protein